MIHTSKTTAAIAPMTLAEEHRALCHSDGSECEDGCDRAPLRPLWISAAGERGVELSRIGAGLELHVEIGEESDPAHAEVYSLEAMQTLGIALGAPASAHIAAQAAESARWLRQHGWAAHDGPYDIGAYHGDREALDRRLGRLASPAELAELERLIRSELSR